MKPQCRFLLPGGALVAALALAAYAEPFAVDDHTLFLAHFDQSLKADFAKGNPTPQAGAASITSDHGGKFGEGVICKDGSATDPAGKSIQFQPFSYERKGNLDLAKGTVEFWTRLDDVGRLPASKLRLRYFFDLPTSEKDGAGNTVRVTILQTEAEGGSVVYVFPGTLIESGPDAGKLASDLVPVSWKAGEWHHVAVTWNDTQLVLFVDGKSSQPLPLRGGLFGGSKSALEALAGTFLIGGLLNADTTIAPGGVIDELRISDNVRYANDFEPK